MGSSEVIDDLPPDEADDQYAGGVRRQYRSTSSRSRASRAQSQGGVRGVSGGEGGEKGQAVRWR